MEKIQNPLRHVYDLQGNYSAKDEIPTHPLYIDIEPTNYCNLNCIFCLRNQMKREKGYMPFEDFKKLAKDAKDANVMAIRMIGWGEPFLHKDIYEMIKEINSLGMISHITTNGFLIDIQKVLDSGLKSIYFSMQGLNQEEYSKLRNNNNFPELKNKIKELITERNKRNLNYPYVQINTFITDESEEEIANFKKEWDGVVDLVSISHMWLERIEDKKIIEPWIARSKPKQHLFKCNEVRAKLAVHWNGTTTPCCEDCDEIFNVGNVFTKSLQEIWDSNTSKGIRLILCEYGNQDMFTLCKKCELCHSFRGDSKE